MDVIVRASFVDVDNDDVHDLLSDLEGQSIVAKHSTGQDKGPILELEGVTEIDCASTADVW